MTEHDEARLPKWAQRRLVRMREDVAFWRTRALAFQAARIGETPDEPVAYAQILDGGRLSLVLLPSTTVRFALWPQDPTRFLDAAIVHTAAGLPYLQVRASGSRLVFRADAANVIDVCAEGGG